MYMLHAQPFCLRTPKGPCRRCRCRSPFPSIVHAMTLCECCTTKNQNYRQKNPQLYLKTANLILPGLPRLLGDEQKCSRKRLKKSGASTMATNCTVAKKKNTQSDRICNKHRKHKHRFTLWLEQMLKERDQERATEKRRWSDATGSASKASFFVSMFCLGNALQNSYNSSTTCR